MITAVFNGSAYARATGLWQYDYGQILRIQGLSLPAAVKVDFSLSETGSESVPRVGITKDGITDAPIPDSMLENGDTTMDYDIYAFVYLEDETSGKTTHRITMPVKSRPKPEAFNTPEDAQLFREAIAAVNESAGRAEAAEKLAEAWAHGHEEYPEREQDNSKYYAGVAEEKAGAANDAMEQATKSAAEALQSEQAAKYSETAAQEAQAGAEATEMQAELHALDAAASASGAELAKTQAQENAQQASEDREAVQKLSDGFATACEKAVRDIHTAGENQANAVDEAGQKALENIGTGIDNTLTKDGKAADAGATGRAIDGLKGGLGEQMSLYDGILQIKPSANLLNPEKLMNKKTIDANGNVADTTADTSVSEFIEVDPSIQLRVTTYLNQSLIQYDSNGSKLTGTSTFNYNTPITLESNAKYIRIKVYNNSLPFMLYQSDTVKNYEEY